MRNLMVYHVIADRTDEIQLSVMENDEGELTFPSISFKEKNKKEIYWDNPLWIFNTFRASLLNFLNRSMGPEDWKNLSDFSFISEEYARDLLEMLEEGVKRGWDKAK